MTTNSGSEAIRQMEDRDRAGCLRAAIAEGDVAWQRGDVTEWTADSMDELIREADEEDRLGLPIKKDILPED